MLGLSVINPSTPKSINSFIVSQWGVPVVTEKFIKTAKNLNKLVHVWTIDDQGTMNELIDLGVDGLMTDKPSVLKKALIARGLFQSGTRLNKINPGINKRKRLRIPKPGLLVKRAIPETINGPIKTDDLPIKL